MSTPLFEMLKRNLAVPDVDRGMPCASDLRRRRGLRPETIAAFKIAHHLHYDCGLSLWAACRQGAEDAGSGWQSIYANWGRYETRLREDGLL